MTIYIAVGLGIGIAAGLAWPSGKADTQLLTEILNRKKDRYR